MFYPETSYWVSVDIDVPLFLPLYGQRRQHDLRRIANKEIQSQKQREENQKSKCCSNLETDDVESCLNTNSDADGNSCSNDYDDLPPFRIQGQMIFDSGWEWGYWLNDLIAARASWDPSLEISNVTSVFV